MNKAEKKMSVNDLMLIGDSAACNILDMIDGHEVDPKDESRIAELYEAHDDEFKTGSAKCSST